MLHDFGMMYTEGGYLIWTTIAVLIQWVMCDFRKGDLGIIILVLLSAMFSTLATYGKYYCK